MTIRASLAAFALLPVVSPGAEIATLPEAVLVHFETHCLDCHDAETRKGGLDLLSELQRPGFDGSLVFENLITGRMPPARKPQPDAAERQAMLEWLATREATPTPATYRRVSRHEFVRSVNDLLGIELDVVASIPEDRDTHDFDSNRKIRLTREMLGAYFAAADEMLDVALPAAGFPPERIWRTRRVKESHETYRIYVHDDEEGLLFSWTRANNGNAYSYFYDGFEPPVEGWYELSFEAAKRGDFEGDIALMVFAGKHYIADDRPQPQRLLDVISLGNQEVKTHTIRGFLRPGENVSVLCQSPHTYRQKKPGRGASIRELTIRGPQLDAWPPKRYEALFEGLPLDAPPRRPEEVATGAPTTRLEQIGGRISAVSSEQKGMERHKLQDVSTKTFWHTRFSPTLAAPPHFVVIENPKKVPLEGLAYRSWTDGNGNGQVTGYEILLSDDGKRWESAGAGNVDRRLDREQRIPLPEPATKRFVKFLVTDFHTIDGRSLASIGELDVLPVWQPTPSPERLEVTVASAREADLRAVIRRFAERAFSSRLTEQELEPYHEVALDELRAHGNFVTATRSGLKAILCSHRFLLAPGVHTNPSYARAADLARSLWLSVPDETLLTLAAQDTLRGEVLAREIERMLLDPRSERMIHSLCAQWLNLRALNKIAPSQKLYPENDELLTHFLPLETEATLAHLLQHNLPVDHLVDADFAIINQRLARHYGIGGVVGHELRKVALPPESPRGGLLTMASVLKVTADGFDTSPILRGAWISKHLVGNTLSPPPENVGDLNPDLSQATTLKEQIAAHKESKSCRACHKSIDPYGFALESFDAIGQWRTRYRIKQPHKATFSYRPQGYYKLAGEVDASGEIDGRPFEDIFGLKEMLRNDHRKVAYNFSKTFFEYFTGYHPGLEQRLALHRMIPCEAAECRLRDLCRSVIIYALTGNAP